MKIFKYIILTLVLLIGVSSYTQAQELNYIDSSDIGIDVRNDSIYTLSIKYDIFSETSLNEEFATWSVYRGYTNNKNFWLGTGSLAMASIFYTAAAWSDPIVYIESHKYYTRDYYNKSVKKRNVKIITGVAFTGLAVYFYSKINRKHRVRWILGPDGIKYTF